MGYGAITAATVILPHSKRVLLPANLLKGSPTEKDFSVDST